jgi:hypothetical protein
MRVFERSLISSGAPLRKNSRTPRSFWLSCAAHAGEITQKLAVCGWSAGMWIATKDNSVKLFQ